MILYKYVGYEAGIEILENNTIGFRQPFLFNDPFELSAAYPIEEEDNPVKALFGRTRTSAKKYIWETNYAVLSLTRSPLNALMWAHYAKEHKGFVIGVDVSNEIFKSEEKNLIPVQFGNIIYTTIKPTHDFISDFKETIWVGDTYHFVYGQLEKLQRIYLYKPMYWSYEEEVRVVKCIKGVKEKKTIVSGEFEVLQIDGNDLYALKLPKGVIKEIYLGIRNPVLKKELAEIRLLKNIEQKHPKANVFACDTGDKSWGIEAKLMEKG